MRAFWHTSGGGSSSSASSKAAHTRAHARTAPARKAADVSTPALRGLHIRTSDGDGANYYRFVASQAAAEAMRTSGNPAAASSATTVEQQDRHAAALSAVIVLVTQPLVWLVRFPHSALRIVLDIVALLLVIFSTLYIPFAVGFDEQGPSIFQRIDGIGSDVVFGLDMLVSIISWRAAPDNDETYEELRAQLAKHTFSKADMRSVRGGMGAAAVLQQHAASSYTAMPLPALPDWASGVDSSAFEGLVIREWRSNLARYVYSGAIIIDLLSVIPIDTIVAAALVGSGGGSGGGNSISAIRLVRAIRILRLVRKREGEGGGG